MLTVSCTRMKITTFIPVIALLLIAGCSSGSSDESEPQASTNTEPANANGVSGEDNLPGDDTTGDTDSEQPATGDNGNVPAPVDDDGDGNQIVEGTQNPGGDTNGGLNDSSLFDPESGAGQLHARVLALARASLGQLNTKLNQGEILSQQENDCVGAFEPALGAPLLSINCLQALSVNNTPMYMRTASVADTPECRSSLLNNNADNCDLTQAELTVNTLWFVPTTAPGQPERPQPKAGARISYAIVADVLSLSNLDDALSGRFNCEYSLVNGVSSGTSPGSNCDDQARRISELIDEHLANSRL